MKFTEAKTKCPCGEDIKARVAKPNAVRYTVANMTCKACKSRFLLVSWVQKGSFPRKFLSDVSILELSKKAKAIVRKKVKDKEQKGA